MKNRFERRGDVAVIFVVYKGDQHEVLIDWEDLAKVKPYSWRLNKGRHSPYVVTDAPGRYGKRRKIWLHKLVVGIGCDYKVDHRNWNGLDNRKSNLRRASHSQNALNMRRPLANNESGSRGVSFCAGRSKPWRASLQFKTRKKHLGYFATQDDAAGAVTAELVRRGIPVAQPTAEDYERAEEAAAIAARMGGTG